MLDGGEPGYDFVGQVVVELIDLALHCGQIRRLQGHTLCLNNRDPSEFSHHDSLSQRGKLTRGMIDLGCVGTGAGAGGCIDGLTYLEAPVNGSPPENEAPDDVPPPLGAT